MLAERFWSAYIKDYLLGLQTRGKWQNPSPDVEVGMVVMMIDPRVHRSSWQIGKVVKVFPGADGRVRTADVEIHDRIYTRPIARLIVLPEITDAEDNPDDADPD